MLLCLNVSKSLHRRAAADGFRRGFTLFWPRMCLVNNSKTLLPFLFSSHWQPGEVHPRQVFFHRPRVQERDPGCHPSSRVPPDRGRSGRLWTDSGRPHGCSASVLHQTRWGLIEDTGLEGQSLGGTNVLIVVYRKPANTHSLKKIVSRQLQYPILLPNTWIFSVILQVSAHTNMFLFFLFLGITKLRFKPAYNPYTEPSMEVFSYHEGFYVALLV